jgi:hypothetical protein
MKRASRRLWLLPLVATLVLGVAIAYTARRSDGPPVTGQRPALATLAISDDVTGIPLAVLFVGDPSRDAMTLPAGEFGLLAIDGGGRIARHHVSLQTAGRVPLDQLQFAGPDAPAQGQHRRELAHVVEFFVVNEWTTVRYLERQLRTGGQLDDGEAREQFADIQQLGRALDQGITSLNALAVAQPAGGPPGMSIRANASVGPVSFIAELLKWKDSLTGASREARATILRGLASLPDDAARRALLQEIDSGRRTALGIPDDPEEFRAKLQAGELDSQANQIHQDLYHASAAADVATLLRYAGQAQDSGNRPIDQAAEQGA